MVNNFEAYFIFVLLNYAITYMCLNEASLMTLLLICIIMKHPWCYNIFFYRTHDRGSGVSVNTRSREWSFRQHTIEGVEFPSTHGRGSGVSVNTWSREWSFRQHTVMGVEIPSTDTYSFVVTMLGTKEKDKEISD